MWDAKRIRGIAIILESHLFLRGRQSTGSDSCAIVCHVWIFPPVNATRECSAANVACFTLLLSSCLGSRTSRLMVQQWSTISLACQVTRCTQRLRRERERANERTRLSLCLCPRPPPRSLPLPQAFLPPQVRKVLQSAARYLQTFLLPADTMSFLRCLTCVIITQSGGVNEVNRIQCSSVKHDRLQRRSVSGCKVNTVVTEEHY